MFTLCLSITSQKREVEGIVGHAFEHQGGGAVGQRPIEDIAVAGHPAHIGRAPINVAVVIIEHVMMGDSGVEKIAAEVWSTPLGFPVEPEV